MSDTSRYLFDFRIRFLPSLIRHGLRKRLSIYFGPRLPHRRTIMYKICRSLCLNVLAGNAGRADLSVYWEDTTFAKELQAAEPISNRMLNGTCRDITKVRVDEVFTRIFGYGMNFDPASFTGKCVMKSDTNALHDGRIVDCPTERTKGYVYQRLIDNTVEKGVRDYRVPVYGDLIPFVYAKDKDADVRFTNEIRSVRLIRTESVFSSEEQLNILHFCREMGLDFGELDILRDNGDGRIYIIDVNKTPWGPPFSISEEDKAYALTTLASAFSSTFLSEL